MKTNTLFILTTIFISTFLLSACNQSTEETKIKVVEKTTDSIANTAQWWVDRHNHIISSDFTNADVIFLGDSITQQWEDQGVTIWEQYFGDINPVNMGFSGDKTQNLLWRINNGALDNVAPKTVFLLIGTNNSPFNTAEEIIAGIKANINAIHNKLPEAKITLLSIFPRDKVSDSKMQVIAAVNEQLLTEITVDYVNHLNLTEHFVDSSGNTLKEYMPDGLHLSELGYQVWADGIVHITHQ